MWDPVTNRSSTLREIKWLYLKKEPLKEQSNIVCVLQKKHILGKGKRLGGLMVFRTCDGIYSNVIKFNF